MNDDDGEIAMLIDEIEGRQSTDPSEKSPSLDLCLRLPKLEAIFAFDPLILTRDTPLDTHCDSPLHFDDLKDDIDFVFIKDLEVVDFYSSDKQCRENAFQKRILQPVLDILKEMGEKCMKRPGKARYVGLFRCLSYIEVAKETGLIAIAVRDIFSHPPQGFRALRDAYNEIETKGTLSDETFDRLVLFRKLAGYFYDKKALKFLITMVEPVLKFKADQKEERLSMLRFLQLAGEYFKHLLPSTLKLSSDMAIELINLRDRLSHMNHANLDKICLGDSNTEQVFEKVRGDIIQLENRLKHMLKCYNEQYSGLSSDDIWKKLKNFPETDLGKPKTQQDTPPHIQQDTSLQTQQDTPPQTQQDTSLQTQQDTPPPTPPHTQHVWNGLKSLLNLMTWGTPSVVKKKPECIILKKKIKKYVDQLLSGFKGIDKKKVVSIRNKLNGIFSSIQDKPCHGYGNLSEKYAELVENINDACDPDNEGCEVEDNKVFNWLSKPSSTVETLFHEMHRTGICTKADKYKLRCKRIENILGVIESLRIMAKINTDLIIEVSKQANEKVLNAKADRMISAIQDLEMQVCLEVSKRLNGLHTMLLNRKKDIKSVDTEPKLKDILSDAGKIIDDFLKECPEGPQLQQELKNPSREQKFCQIECYIKRKQVKKDHRFHLPTQQIVAMRECFTNGTSLMTACEFNLVVVFELLKEVSDYPELKCLTVTSQIRNYLSHLDPFGSELLYAEEEEEDKMKAQCPSSPQEVIAKEVSVLCINVKFILEDFLSTLPRTCD